MRRYRSSGAHSGVQSELRELARRQDASATVVLFWRPEDDAVFVVLSDRVERNAAITQVAPDEALDAYWHPYVHRDRPDPAQPTETHGYARTAR